MVKPTLHCPCEGVHLEQAFNYTSPPAGETRFDLAAQQYDRAYNLCQLCGHWFSNHCMTLDGLYGGAYVDNTYGHRLETTFERIIALPPEQSDNTGRVARLAEFSKNHFNATQQLRLLDIGSGLGVFPYAMKQAGWDCTVIDPDPRSTKHATEVIGVKAITGDFMNLDTSHLGKFDVITFNKVLEHVEDPIAMLKRALPLLAPYGFVYLEVPDGEAAAMSGADREEFFIEHHHVFSATSSSLLATQAGFSPIAIERLREPSTKFTLRLFVKPSNKMLEGNFKKATKPNHKV